MRVQLPGVGRSVDSIVVEAFKVLDCAPWGGQSAMGWSKQSDFLRCPYRYYLKHVRGVGPLVVGDTGPALDIGSIVHLLLAARYSAMLPDHRYPGWRPNPPDPFVLLRTLESCGLPLSISQEVERLYEGYAEKYGADLIVPMAVEFGVGNPAFHTSRYDLVFYVEDGIHDGFWIGEHKTMSSATDIETFRFNGEVLGEMLSWRLSGLDTYFGGPLNGVCINALVKTKSVPRYQRLWIPVNWAMIDHYAGQREQWVAREAACVQSAVWPQSLAGCNIRYSKCRFWEHCSTDDESQLVSIERRPINA